MRSLLAVMRRDLTSSFNSPIAYVVILFFLVFTSVWFFFIQQFFAQDVASLRGYFAVFPTVFVLVIPALTMRSWAEERKLGTDELLLTFPLRDGALVMGKFLAGFALLLMMLLLTLPVPLSIIGFGHFERGQIVGQYLGALLLGGAGLSIGYFLSSVSTNQITAFLATVFLLLVLTFIGQLPKFLSLPEFLVNILTYLSVDAHFESFRKGVIDTRDLAYFLILSVAFLYANTKVLVLSRCA